MTALPQITALQFLLTENFFVFQSIPRHLGASKKSLIVRHLKKLNVKIMSCYE